MVAKKATKQDAAVRIDPSQMPYLRYINLLTGTPITVIVKAAVEEWLDISYSHTVRDLEKKRGLPATIGKSDETRDLNVAYENMLKNLETLERPKRLRHFTAKA